jgi:hypothetical protein
MPLTPAQTSQIKNALIRLKPQMKVAYSTRNLPRELRDRLRVEAALSNPKLTMEQIVNRAIELGIAELEARRANGSDERG